MYNIKITKTQDEEVIKRNYEVTGKKENGDNEYGYVVDKVIEPVTKEIYSQTFEDIILEDIIKTVNKLS